MGYYGTSKVEKRKFSLKNIFFQIITIRKFSLCLKYSGLRFYVNILLIYGDIC